MALKINDVLERSVAGELVVNAGSVGSGIYINGRQATQEEVNKNSIRTTVFLYQVSDEQPEPPSNTDVTFNGSLEIKPTSPWQLNIEYSNDSTIWQASTTFYYKDQSFKKENWQIIKASGQSGKDGLNGADGTKVEYIMLTTSNKLEYDYNDNLITDLSTINHKGGDSTVVNPTTLLTETDAYQTDNYVPEGWSDDPLGVDETYPYEYYSVRYKTTIFVGSTPVYKWGPFSIPRLRSNFSKDGVDGNNIEYIYYKAQQTDVYPELSYNPNGEYFDYIPWGW